MSGILFVCTANQIRSVMAERMLRAALGARFGPAAGDWAVAAVTSAGTAAAPGYPTYPQARTQLTRRGISSDGHASRLLTAALIGHADLVLTASRRQRDHAGTLGPEGTGKVLTLREAAWLLDGVGRDGVPGRALNERVEILPAVLRTRRGLRALPAPEALDIADPIGGTDDDFARAAHEIEQALLVLLDVL